MVITRVNRLTRRELEVLGLVAEGLANKQIARRLHISMYTVKNHIHNILEKTQTQTRYEAVEQILGIVNHPPSALEVQCVGCGPLRKMLVIVAELRRLLKVLEIEEQANERITNLVDHCHRCDGNANGSGTVG